MIRVQTKKMISNRSHSTTICTVQCIKSNDVTNKDLLCIVAHPPILFCFDLFCFVLFCFDLFCLFYSFQSDEMKQYLPHFIAKKMTMQLPILKTLLFICSNQKKNWNGNENETVFPSSAAVTSTSHLHLHLHSP